MRTIPVLKKGSTVLLTCRNWNSKTGVVETEKIKAEIFRLRQNGSVVEFSYASTKKVQGVYESLIGDCAWKPGKQRKWGIIGLEVL